MTHNHALPTLKKSKFNSFVKSLQLLHTESFRSRSNVILMMSLSDVNPDSHSTLPHNVQTSLHEIALQD